MNKEIQDKIASCKALQGMTVFDLISTVRFRDNLAAYMQAQKADRAAIRASYDAMRKLGGAKGYKLPSHVIDDVINMPLVDFVKAYMEVIAGTSNRPLAERRYIKQLGQQAYNLTVAQYVVEEYPELEPVLIPKAKAN